MTHAEHTQRQQVTVAGHELRVFVETPPLIEAMVEDLRAAQERIWLECYMFAADAAGNAVAVELMARAQAGIDVRVLYDAFGSQSTPARFFHELQASGVRVVAFNHPWDGLRRLTFLQTLNRRDHRKLLVIDDRVAYFGGMNLIDEGTDAEQGGLQHKLGSGGWRDVHIRLDGPQQAEIAESFDRSWRRAQRLKVRRRSRAYRRGMLPSDHEAIRFYDSGPGRRYTRAARVYHRMIRHARDRITFSMAYFLPVGGVLRSLLRASKRGVRIRVVVPCKSDVRVVEWATRHQYRLFLRHGIRIYERQKQMLHSKLMLVDNEWTLVGSCNLDSRSLWYNYEFMAVIRSRELTSLLAKVCQDEMRQSTLVTRAQVRRWTWWQRIMARAMPFAGGYEACRGSIARRAIRIAQMKIDGQRQMVRSQARHGSSHHERMFTAMAPHKRFV